MKFGSVCSGIEAASVAWHPLGWKAAWLSEIEPFPSAVLAHHYPDVPNLGDMTTLPERILSGEVEAPDLFCGGTPCQAFSVAGLRNSLDDARGNLSLTFVGNANAIDYVRSVRSAPPAIVFWENVPGVLSTKDNAFGCFLAGLAGEDNPLEPPGGKWTNAGYVLGPKRAVAWRVLDAQYFGVAQRRKRVFVVASARDDFDPAAVLFEFDCVRRDTAPSRETGKAIAPCVTNGPSFSRTGNERVEAEAMVVQATTYSTPAIGVLRTDEVSSCITKNTGGGGETQNPAFVVQPAYAIQGSMIGRNDSAGPKGDGINEEVCFTQNTIDRHAVAQPIALQDVTPREKAQNGRGWNDDGTAYTVDTHATQGVAQPYLVGSLCARTGQSISVQDADQGHLMAVAQPVPFQQTADCLTAAYGTKWNGNASATNGSLFVAQPMVLMDQGGSVMNVEHDMVGTLRRETHGHEPVVMQQIGIFQDSEFGVAQYDSAGTLRAGRIPEHQMVMQSVAYNIAPGKGELKDDIHVTDAKISKTIDASGSNPSMHQGGAAIVHAVAQPVAFAQNTRNEVRYVNGDGSLVGALAAEPGMKQTSYIQQSMAVRRLTPVECERLQGFPDNYTNIPWRKKDESPDGLRYKALGNSWAVPNVRWIGKRIQEALNALP
jgi:site-specific DNA-cytosine methylase